jgi:hypothetical protein
MRSILCVIKKRCVPEIVPLSKLKQTYLKEDFNAPYNPVKKVVNQQTWFPAMNS